MMGGMEDKHPTPTPTLPSSRTAPAAPPTPGSALAPPSPRTAAVPPTPSPALARAPGARDQPRQATSLRFGTVASVLAEVAKAEGLVTPAFRSPPALVGVSRSIRRRRGGQTTVAVALRGRPWAAVLADMVEGVVVANRLRGVPADRCRVYLWDGLGAAGEAGGPPAPTPSVAPAGNGGVPVVERAPATAADAAGPVVERASATAADAVSDPVPAADGLTSTAGGSEGEAAEVAAVADSAASSTAEDGKATSGAKRRQATQRGKAAAGGTVTDAPKRRRAARGAKVAEAGAAGAGIAEVDAADAGAGPVLGGSETSTPSDASDGRKARDRRRQGRRNAPDTANGEKAAGFAA